MLLQNIHRKVHGDQAPVHKHTNTQYTLKQAHRYQFNVLLSLLQLMQRDVHEDQAFLKAMDQRDKLIDFEQNRSARTTVIDDQASQCYIRMYAQIHKCKQKKNTSDQTSESYIRMYAQTHTCKQRKTTTATD